MEPGAAETTSRMTPRYEGSPTVVFAARPFSLWAITSQTAIRLLRPFVGFRLLICWFLPVRNGLRSLLSCPFRSKKKPLGMLKHRRRAQSRKSGGNPRKVLSTLRGCCQVSIGKSTVAVSTSALPITWISRERSGSCVLPSKHWPCRLSAKWNAESGRSNIRSVSLLISIALFGLAIATPSCSKRGLENGGRALLRILRLVELRLPLATRHVALGTLPCTPLSEVSPLRSLLVAGGVTSIGRFFSALRTSMKPASVPSESGFGLPVFIDGPPAAKSDTCRVFRGSSPERISGNCYVGYTRKSLTRWRLGSARHEMVLIDFAALSP